MKVFILILGLVTCSCSALKQNQFYKQSDYLIDYLIAEEFDLLDLHTPVSRQIKIHLLSVYQIKLNEYVVDDNNYNQYDFKVDGLKNNKIVLIGLSENFHFLLLEKGMRGKSQELIILKSTHNEINESVRIELFKRVYSFEELREQVVNNQYLIR